MTDNRKVTPLHILHDLEQRAVRTAYTLPHQTTAESSWDGIGFRMADILLVTPTDGVSEILAFPPLTKIPGAKKWVLGIANIRGNLVPIIDLHGFVADQMTDIGAESRVLIVQQHGVVAGLLIEEVLGMKHFFNEQRLHSNPRVSGAIDPYLKGTYRSDNVYWWVFDPTAVIMDERFMLVAA